MRTRVISTVLAASLLMPSYGFARPDYIANNLKTKYQVSINSETCEKEKEIIETCNKLIDSYKRETLTLEQQNKLLREQLKNCESREKESSVPLLLWIVLGILTGGLIVAFVK